MTDAPPTAESAAGPALVHPSPPVPIVRQRRPWTLRSKLIAASVLLVLFVCGVTGVATQLSLSHYLTAQVDQRLTTFRDGPDDNPGGRQNTGSLNGYACTQNTNVEEGPHFRGGGPGFTNTLAATIANGQIASAVLYTQNNCLTVSADAAQEILAAVGGAKPITVDVAGYGQFRVVGTTGAGGVTAVIGLPLDREIATRNQLIWTLVIVMAIALVVATVGAYLIVRRTLRPLDRVAATARQVSTMPLHRGEVDLGIRVPARDTDARTEVGQVGAALNQMLGHVSTALERRQASETQVRRFVADASHELRTPLAAIRGYTELARRSDADADTVTHALSRVDSESARMSVLVDDLLLLARLDAGRPLAEDEVDLTLLTMDVVSDARVAGPEHIWRLDLPAEPVSVTGDQPRLHQVLANLLTNARTHTPAGTTVTTGISTHDGDVRLTVTDNGPGIDSSLLPGIFGRFVRGDSSRSRQAGSTGLGLAIVRAVVSAHHGTVTAESSPGQTTFTVKLAAHPEN